MKAPFLILGATLVAGAAGAQTPMEHKYTPCVDYFQVGGSRCAPISSAVAAAPASTSPAPVPSGRPSADPVQSFLDNHGKPPREFAEFYVNPTPENARRWVEAFRAQQTKANAMAEAWRQAEQALPGANEPVRPAASPPLPAAAPVAGPVTTAAAATPTAPRLGRFATPAEQLPILVYYFSASCPFCARLKPDLMAMTQPAQGKLLFTCVDLTPLSPRQAPSPGNRTGLPCDWRLPQPGEVERLQIRQTPTLLISRPGQGGQRLTGVISPGQLQTALFGQN